METTELTWDGFTVPTKYWHLLDDGRIQCDVCRSVIGGGAQKLNSTVNRQNQ